ncbi:MAG TPA: FAD/NAD(P)-binding protein [Acidimicrobiales bacterium]|nr:FAD/NAD(P)-binding protein [Acidimicrobiales bacterium]
MTDGCAPPGPLVPRPHRVTAIRRETTDVVTLTLEPTDGLGTRFHPGQFNMLTAFGVGEMAVSMSSRDVPSEPTRHTVRDVGPVSHALCHLPVGAVVGVRGPFGTDWGVDEVEGRDVVVVAGGIGLAPLRGAIDTMVATMGRPRGARRVFVLVGARSPDQVMFGEDLRRWEDAGAQVETAVDSAGRGWAGHVGVVTTLVPGTPFEPARTSAMVCGPEVMMRFTVRSLLDRGVEPPAVKISLERNMQCGVGHCGHCQLGPLLLCRDGPVVRYAGPVPALLSERQR